MPLRNKGVRDRGTVQSIERGLDLLEALAVAQGGVGVVDLSSRVSLHTSTVHRLLSTLLARGYVSQDSQTGQYSLGPRVLPLAHAFQDHSEIRAIARRHLQSLMEATGETANLIFLDHAEAVYVDQVPSPRLVRMFAAIGRRVPLHSTGCGKVFLANMTSADRAQIVKERGLPKFTRHTITTIAKLEHEMAEIRRCGFAVDDQEHDEGVRCVAAPIRDHTGNVVAAISIAGPTTRVTKDRIPELSRLVMKISAQLSANLGHTMTHS